MRHSTSPISLAPWVCDFYPNESGFLLTKDYAFTDLDGVNRLVPKFFWFNGASIPRPLWPFIYSPFHPEVILGSLVHDWLYTSHIVTKEHTDELLHKICIEEGADERKAAFIFNAVNRLGDPFWKNSETDLAYFSHLKDWIVKSGRKLSDYGI